MLGHGEGRYDGFRISRVDKSFGVTKGTIDVLERPLHRFVSGELRNKIRW